MSNKIGLQLISFNQRLQFGSKYNYYTTNKIFLLVKMYSQHNNTLKYHRS